MSNNQKFIIVSDSEVDALISSLSKIGIDVHSCFFIDYYIFQQKISSFLEKLGDSSGLAVTSRFRSKLCEFERELGLLYNYMTNYSSFFYDRRFIDVE
ncbi:hypothetical protein [Xylella fastidiosa]|uniref:hypothetical protein n=1 Tax=Xylella fastidiosa TaxID=2371 RepID=UPI00111F171A|nr:hypothetical protein [Xylella fastidiosa]TNW23379.1 hypothetical protein EIP73_11350 [Xylella fastidiosa subsp. pauca]TNW25954.1 hypothetical protein EIP74_06070 [Xylella fastidiosa subsp. pauca]